MAKEIMSTDAYDLRIMPVDISVIVELQKMLVIVLDSAGERAVHRTVNSHNIKKVAKSIHSLYPWSDYPSLEGCIFNAYAKGKKELELEVPYRDDQV